MRKNPRLFRLSATVALAALLFDTILPLGAAFAQPAPPPLPPPGAGRPDLNQADPPARVGRIAEMTGAVSFHNPGDTQWAAATLNYPVSTGNSFWTEPSAEAQLEISDSRIALAGGTEFDVSTLDASGMQGVAAEGEIYLHLRDLQPNEAWAVQTPRGLVQISGDGRYEIVVGTTDQPTLVTVVEGAAQIQAPGVSLQIAAGQTATIIGTDSFQGSVGAEVRDAFLTERLNAERPRPAPAVPPPPQVVAMPGGSDLAATGTWGRAPDYGQVWYPPVPATWVPYREGHWAYVAPWGWTWVDDASWGFAPFHYGRWLQIEGRWAWTPGVVVVSGPPVYAPALVTFIGIGAGVALGAAIAAGSIGWVPLGPREEYHPWYHASNNYVREVNITHVTNITNNVTINNYVNRAAATSIPAAAMVASRPVAAIARPVTPQEFAAARPVVGQEPLRPTAATAGVTPVVARQMHLAPAPAGVEHPAPGPVVRPQTAAAFARPALAPAGRPGSAEPGRPAPGVRPAGETTPEPGQPAGGAPQPGRPAGGGPGAVRPEATPGASRPIAGEARPGERPAAEPARPETRPATRIAPEVEHAAPRPETPRAEPRPEPPRAEPRPEPPRTEPRPETPRAEPRPEPPRAEPRPEPPRAEPRPEPPRPEPRPEPPRAEPRPEPPHAAAPAPRPAPPPHPEPQEHKKEPNEH